MIEVKCDRCKQVVPEGRRMYRCGFGQDTLVVSRDFGTVPGGESKKPLLFGLFCEPCHSDLVAILMRLQSEAQQTPQNPPRAWIEDEPEPQPITGYRFEWGASSSGSA